MKANIGSIDRAIRVVIGLAILAVGYRMHAWWGLLGLLPLLTAVVSWCPVYLPFGIRTHGGPPASTSGT